MGEGQDTTQDKVTIQEAARRLGVKEDAIRKRIQRGSMRHEKAEDGRVYVWVDATQYMTQDTRHASQDTTQYTAQDERLEDLREQVGYLRRQLDEEREARRRADTIIAQLARANEEQARTIRELEAPQEASEVAETVEEEPQRAQAHSGVGGAQEDKERSQQRSGWLAPADRPPWWHYLLGISLVFLAELLSSPTTVYVFSHLPLIDKTEHINMILLIVVYLVFGALIYLPPGVFGFWV